MTLSLSRALAGLALAVTAPALAQDDPSFALDTVLVATFEASPQDRDAADRYARAFEEALRSRWMVFGMADVPVFADYDAKTYVDACPAGQYASCVLVVGRRAQAEWVLGGQVTPLEGGGHQVTLSFVDVTDAELVLQFQVTLDRANVSEVAQGIGPVFEDVLAGVYEGSDIRRLDDEEEDDAPAEVDVPADDGSLDRSGRTGGRAVRVTAADLRQYAEQEGTPPWERVELSRSAWRRWRNSGDSLVAFKERARGRQGAILVGATFVTVGQGPWVQTYEGWYALDGTTLDVLDTSTLQDQARGIERTWDFSLGAGVLPWLDVTVFGGPRVAAYQYRIQRLVEGEEDPFYESPQRKVVSTLIVGGRVGVAPLPAAPARPTFHLGAYYWHGTRQDKVLQAPTQLEVLERPWMAVVQGGPGVEVDVGKVFLLWGRLYVDVPVAGRVAQQALSGGERLPGLPALDTTDDGVGIAGSVGITLQLHVGKRDRARRPR